MCIFGAEKEKVLKHLIMDLENICKYKYSERYKLNWCSKKICDQSENFKGSSRIIVGTIILL